MSTPAPTPPFRLSNAVRCSLIAAATLVVTWVTSVCLPAAALADEANSRSAESTSAFSTVDRLGTRTSFGSQLGFPIIEDNDDVTFLRAELFGQYVSESGFGGYGNFSFSTAFGSDDSEFDLGGLELGGLYAARLTALDVVFRAGLVLPTAAETDFFGIGVANSGGILTRPTDLMLVAPATTALRLSVSPMATSGQLFFRADLGLDVALATPDDIDVDPFVRVNAAAGVHVNDSISLALELMNLGALDGDRDLDEMFIHSIGVTAQVRVAEQLLYASITSPLDEGARGDAVFITIGARRGF